MSSYGHLDQQQVLVAVEPSEWEPFEQELAADKQVEQQELSGRQEQLEQQEQKHIRKELRSHKREQSCIRKLRQHIRRNRCRSQPKHSPSKHNRCRIRRSCFSCCKGCRTALSSGHSSSSSHSMKEPIRSRSLVPKHSHIRWHIHQLHSHRHS